VGHVQSLVWAAYPRSQVKREGLHTLSLPLGEASRNSGHLWRGRDQPDVIITHLLQVRRSVRDWIRPKRRSSQVFCLRPPPPVEPCQAGPSHAATRTPHQIGPNRAMARRLRWAPRTADDRHRPARGAPHCALPCLPVTNPGGVRILMCYRISQRLVQEENWLQSTFW
jgi:hypothetical protein